MSTLTRRELQTMAKAHGIPANKKSTFIIQELEALSIDVNVDTNDGGAATARFYVAATCCLVLLGVYFMFVFPPLESVPGTACTVLIQEGAGQT